MARPINKAPLPQHSAVGEERFMERMYGRLAYCANVTCPTCGKTRPSPVATLRQQMGRPTFTGGCLTCISANARAGKRRLGKARGKKRWVTSNGYIALSSLNVSDEDLDLFVQMRKKASFVLEHRFVMAKLLGRALHAYECVDHMDGDKTNNRADNLRLYLRGRQEPGSCPGYGTYYHEWQMAEKKLRDNGLG